MRKFSLKSAPQTPLPFTAINGKPVRDVNLIEKQGRDSHE